MVRTGFPRKTACAFTLVEVVVVVAVMAVLAAIFLPQWARQKRRVSRLGCVNQLKQIGLAFRQWSIDYNDKFPMQVSVTNGGTMELVNSGSVWPHFQVMSNELNNPKVLVCPNDTNRTPASTFTQNLNDSQISYFVGVDANPTKPAMFLAGDNNLGLGSAQAKHGMLQLSTNSPVAWVKPRHNHGGNIDLVDNSVQQVGDAQLRELLQKTGMATNRLAIP